MADLHMHFAVKSIGLSTYGGRKPQTLLNAARHNLREIQAELGADRRIDATRTDQNAILEGPSTAAGVSALAEKLLREAGIVSKDLRKDHCQAVELVFSLPVGSTIAPEAYFEQSLRWAKTAYRLPILLATVHLDEGAKHMHVLLLPLAHGVYVGSKPIAKTVTHKHMESFFKAVAGPFGLSRGGAKFHGMAKRYAAAEVLIELEQGDPAQLLSAILPQLRSFVTQDPTPFFRALEIDPERIRAAQQLAEKTLPAKPIGFEKGHAKPIGFEPHALEDQNLSCVGFSIPTEQENEEKSAVATPRPKPPSNVVLAIPAIEAPPAVLEECRTVRTHDEHCDDLSAWEEFGG